MQWKRITAVAATVMLAVAACGSPSSNSNSGGKHRRRRHGPGEGARTRPLKGPAPEIEGAKKGGTVTVLSDVTPDTFDPTNTYFVDGNQIEKLMYRTLTQYKLDEKTGKPILVPDLAEDLGTRSADGLTWTFKLKQGIKYNDGSAGQGRRLRVRDQAVLRHRAVRRRTDVPERSSSRTATSTTAPTRAATTTPGSRRRMRAP